MVQLKSSAMLEKFCRFPLASSATLFASIVLFAAGAHADSLGGVIGCYFYPTSRTIPNWVASMQ